MHSLNIISDEEVKNDDENENKLQENLTDAGNKLDIEKKKQ